MCVVIYYKVFVVENFSKKTKVIIVHIIKSERNQNDTRNVPPGNAFQSLQARQQNNRTKFSKLKEDSMHEVFK